ncbi:MAG: hypothetical protein IT331_22060 [Anaerolineae bacterium]|nr:hypothetical protein [Anaerolineae bacterium]
MDTATTALQRERTGAAVSLFLFLLTIYLLTMGGHTYAPDDESMFYVTESMVRRGEFDIPNFAEYPTVSGWYGVEGKTFTGSGIAQSVAAIPFYVAGAQVAEWFTPPFEGVILRLAVNTMNPLISALLGVVLFAFAISLGYSTRVSLGLALIWGLATFAWIEAKTFYNEPLMGLLALLAFYFMRCAHQTPRALWFVLAGSFWALSATTKIHAFVALPALLCYGVVIAAAGWRTGGDTARAWRNALKYAAGFALPVVVILGAGILFYNYLRFLDPLEMGYGGEPASYPILNGLYGILASPGRSIFLYAPPILLGLIALPWFARQHRLEAWVFAFYFFTALFFHARYENWSSGGTWGNRYIYPVLPFLILPAGVLFENARGWFAKSALALVVALGVLVQLTAVPLNFDTYINTNLSRSSRFYEVENSPIVAHARMVPERFNLWWNQWTLPKPGVVLGAGWLGADAPPGEFFPRYLSKAAQLGIVADPQQPVRVRVQAIDYRPADKPTRELEFAVNGQTLAHGKMQSGTGGEAVYAFEISASHDRALWVDVTTPDTEPTGTSPMGDELGLQVTDVIVTQNDEPLEFYPDLSIPPIPLAIPKAAWSWFYNPALMHWDFWWWYLYYSGVPRGEALRFSLPVLVGLLIVLVGSGASMLRYLIKGARHAAVSV